jgi:endonuclease YncB( thermonuclease family)
MSGISCVRWRGVGLYAAVVVQWCLLAPLLVSAEQFTGKVVGISDGDTISVLREGRAVKVRLHGVDTPEEAQAFGTQAHTFTGEMVFQRDVTVVVHTTDRYGRLVGEVLLSDGRNLNQELVRAGLAWWYRAYAPTDTRLAQLEDEARAAHRGLWAAATPVPPWVWRQQHGGRLRAAALPVTAHPAPEGPLIGNQRSRVYHWAGCPDYAKVSAQNRVTFPSREAAEQAGYRPGGELSVSR